MGYTDIYAAATDEDSTLRKQVAVAIHRAAVDVVNESASTENHSDRLSWARKVLRSASGPTTESGAWTWKVLENATIQANPAAATDNDVQFVINGLVDTMAEK